MKKLFAAAAALLLAACETSEVVASRVLMDNETLRVTAEDVDDSFDFEVYAHRIVYYGDNKLNYPLCVQLSFVSHNAHGYNYGYVKRLEPRQRHVELAWGQTASQNDLNIQSDVRAWVPGVNGLADDCSNMPASIAPMR